MSPRKKEINTLSYSILGFFLDKPYYGYELYKHLSQSVEFREIWHIKQSLFYGLLDKFFQNGYLDQFKVEGDQYPSRKEYSLTDEGRQVVLSWMGKPVDHGREMRQEFLAKLFFSMKLDDKSGLLLIEDQRLECMSWLERIAAHELESQSVYHGLIIQYRIKQIEAMIDWLDYMAINGDNLALISKQA